MGAASARGVAPTEHAAIEAVQAAMAPPPWFEQMVDCNSGLFGGTSRGPTIA